MTSPDEERRALRHLAKLLAQNLSELDDEVLVSGLREAELVADQGTAWSARFIAELKGRHSWSEVVALTGMKQTTLHNRLNGRPPKRKPEENTVPAPARLPEPQPVVAAVVTSHLGVLAGRRNDGKPPWTFIAGEVEPLEAPADAAIREVKEETGLEILVGHIEIGRRVHPKTGRLMIYLAGTPVRGTEVFVGDEVELAEVRWLNLAQADELLAGMYGPVREHLGRVIS